MPYNFLPLLPHFPHTRICGCKFDLVLERAMVILGSSFDYTWWTLSPGCYIPRFNLEAFLIRKKIFRCFLPYMGMTTTLLNNAERFEQIDNMPSTEGQKCNLVKIGQTISKKTFKDYGILYMYEYSPEARTDNPGSQILIVTKRVCYFDHTL